MYNKIVRDGLLISKWHDDEQRRELASLYLDYYRGSYRDALKKIIDQQVNPGGAKRLKYFIESQGTTPQLIRDISLVFEQEPKITPAEEVTIDFMEKWNTMLEDISINVVLEDVDKYVELLRDVPVAPFYIDGKLKLKIITPDKCIVHQKQSDPTEMERFLYLVDTQINTPGRAERVDIYACWDYSGDKLRYYTCEIKNNGEIDQETIEELKTPDYGRIPVVIFRNYTPYDSFWYQGCSDLVDKSIAIDLRTTDLAMAEAYHIPQLITKGISDENYKTLTLDRTSYLNIPPNEMGNVDGDAKYITPDSGLKELQERLESRIKLLCRTKGLSSDTIDGITSTSGYQLALSKSDILKINRGKRKHYTKPIKELLKLVIYNLKYNNKVDFTRVKNINIDYGEIEFPQSPEEKARARQMKIQEGIWSPIQSLLEDNPDLSREQAIEKFQEIKEENELTRPPNPFIGERNEEEDDQDTES